MIFPALLKNIFSKSFQIILLLVLICGLSLYFRFPHLFYDNLILSISSLLKTQYGTGGSIMKIDNGMNKFALIISILSLILFIYLKFWKWILTKQTEANNFFYFSKNIILQKKDWIIITCLIIAGGLLRIILINQSLWQDEIGVYNTFIRNGIFSTIFPTNSMGSHPLMQIIIRLFTNIAGVNEFTLRFPIFLISILSIPLVYFVCLNISGKRILAVIAASFLTIHSYHIYYSFQMRGYNILVFLCILSIYLFIKLLSEDKKRTKILFVLVNVLIVYTHLYAIYFIASQQLLIVGFLLYQKYLKKNTEIHISQRNLIIYFHSFIISMLIVLFLYLPQFPVIFMNILDTTREDPEFSLINYFYSVVASSNFVIAFSNNKIICYLFFLLIHLLFLFFVKKNIAYQLIFFMGIILIIITALIPSGSGFSVRYLICEVPLFIITSAIVINELWQSEKKHLKSLSIVLIATYLTITILSFPKTYLIIQDYKGAVAYIHNNRKSAKSIIVSNSLGKSEVVFYDNKIVPLFTTHQFDSISNLKLETYAITTYEEFLGNGLFIVDNEIQKKIKKEFKHIKTFHGEFPVKVWHRE